MLLMCDESSIWRFINSKRKLEKSGKKGLRKHYVAYLSLVGAVLQDADISYELQDGVYVRELSSGEPAENLN